MQASVLTITNRSNGRDPKTKNSSFGLWSLVGAWPICWYSGADMFLMEMGVGGGSIEVLERESNGWAGEAVVRGANTSQSSYFL